MKLYEITTPKSTEQILAQYKITNYVINADGTVDVEGNVDLDNMITTFPIKFLRRE